jgi:uncharacterized protein YutE (UPF0331/DUF86 family)
MLLVPPDYNSVSKDLMREEGREKKKGRKEKKSIEIRKRLLHMYIR